MRAIVLAGVGVVLIAAVWFGTRRMNARAPLTRGPSSGARKPLTNARPGPDGVVRADPQQLARSIGVDLRTYALARMVASEHPHDPEPIRIAVVWATINHARKLRITPETLLLRGKAGLSDGFFGAQYTGKYATTANDPTQQDLDTVLGVTGGQISDPTQGADQFDVPAAQRAAAKRGVTGYTKSPEQVAASRRAAGKRLVLLPGIPEEKFRLWA